MIAGLTIRAEQPGDQPEIYTLVEQAFAPMPFSDGDEQALVNRLRASGELTLSLVALVPQEGLIGHVGFSPVTIDGRDHGWFQLAPVAVAKPWQRQGVGGALIEAGVAEMKRCGAQGIGVVGDPGYYERFGFALSPGLAPGGHDAQYFRSMVLDGTRPSGTIRYASAFG